MRSNEVLVLLANSGFVLASPAEQAATTWSPYFLKPFVNSLSLQWSIQTNALLGHAQALERFAYAAPGRNRLMGTPGHNDTVTYLYQQLTSPALGGYYDVRFQDWIGTIQESGSGSFLVDGVNQTITVADFSSSGDAVAPLGVVNNFGCNATDYPAPIAGKIALISRGDCTFATKSNLAAQAGAVGAVIYNNIPGNLTGITLSPNTTNQARVPTVGYARESGLALVAQINGGATVNGELHIRTVIKDVLTYNVLAQTKGGDPDNVLVVGAHSDSVAAGPGINDDGSGVAGILEVAKQLARYKVKNAVRFGWWSGEEEGLLGSTFYVTNLTTEERQKIRAYLNFDMIASPNYVYGIYDGDGGDFNLTGPPGSDKIEDLFENWFARNDLPWTSTEFSGRSDYQAFINAGIAAGGLFTGAEGNKTVEEAAEFGGEAGVAYDVSYHGPGDNVTNLALDAFLVNSRAIAHSVATYARSFDSLTSNDTDTEEEQYKIKSRNVKRTSDARSKGIKSQACSHKIEI